MIHSVVRRASTDSHLFFKPLRYRLGLLTVAGRLPTSTRFGFPAYHVTVNGAFPWSLRLLVGQALIFWLPSVRLQFTTIKKSEPPTPCFAQPDWGSVFCAGRRLQFFTPALFDCGAGDDSGLAPSSTGFYPLRITVYWSLHRFLLWLRVPPGVLWLVIHLGREHFTKLGLMITNLPYCITIFPHALSCIRHNM